MYRGIARLLGMDVLRRCVIVLGTVLFLVLREAPAFLLSRGRHEQAQRNAARVIRRPDVNYLACARKPGAA